MKVIFPISTLITYVSDYGGIIHRVVVHPSILAPCGVIESVLPDGTNVPVHRDEHPTSSSVVSVSLYLNREKRHLPRKTSEGNLESKV